MSTLVSSQAAIIKAQQERVRIGKLMQAQAIVNDAMWARKGVQNHV